MQNNCQQVLSITSGKGGVGKTITTVNMAIAARKMGRHVLILDGDFGLANVDVVLGLKPRYNIVDVLENRVAIEEVILEGPMGIKIIPSGSGIFSISQLTQQQKADLQFHMQQLKDTFDLLLIDTGAGISDNVIHLNNAAQSIALVTTPEPHALTDAYAMIKVLTERGINGQINVLVNMCHSEEEAYTIYQRLKNVSERFLDRPLEYAGHVPYDPQLQKFIMQRRAASEKSTMTISGQAINKVTRTLLNAFPKQVKPKQDLWLSLVNPYENHAPTVKALLGSA